MDTRPNIVLVHGARADGSCWSGVPAWKSLPSWYLVATEDQAIPPDAERLFASRMGATTVEVASSHVAMVSHPDEVTRLITAAAEACAATGR